jgi:hypothetical protein
LEDCVEHLFDNKSAADSRLRRRRRRDLALPQLRSAAFRREISVICPATLQCASVGASNPSPIASAVAILSCWKLWSVFGLLGIPVSPYSSSAVFVVGSAN